MAQALAVSDNIYAVKTNLFLGADILVETAQKFGISTKLAEVPSLALGTSGVTVMEMANAYSQFANGGKKVEPTLITKVVDYNGNVIYQQEKEHEQILDPSKAFVMTEMLTGIFDPKLNGYASVTGSTIANELTRPYAGKSGSTETDSWMIGFTPQLVTAVWTGYDRAQSIDLVAEKSYAKKIWASFMEDALKDKPIKDFKAPKEGVVRVDVDPSTGKLATKDCPVKRTTYFVAGTEPTEYCTTHLQHKEDAPSPAEEPQKRPWYKKWFPWG